jgi:hypothetical protein
MLLVVFNVFSYAQHKSVSARDLSDRSEIVAVGRVSQVQPQWEDGKGRISTHVTLAVTEYLKGGAGEKHITIITPGGEIDGVGEIYSHSAKFKADEDVVVFAARDNKGRLQVTNGHDGKFTVQHDGATGKSIVNGTRTLDDFIAEMKNSSKPVPPR